MMKNVLILLCLIWITAPTFGQNQVDQDPVRTGGFFYELGYEHVTSDDGSQIFATIQTPKLSYRLMVYTPFLERNQIFGFDPQFGVQLKLAEGNVVQNLKPTFDSPDEQWNVNMGGEVRASASLYMNLVYRFPKQSNHPLLFNFGLELASPMTGAQEVYLTHDPNRSAACATAVNDVIANPALSTEAIKDHCEKTSASEGSQPFTAHFGVDWVPSPHIKLSALMNIPLWIQIHGYRIMRENTFAFGISYVR